MIDLTTPIATSRALAECGEAEVSATLRALVDGGRRRVAANGGPGAARAPREGRPPRGAECGDLEPPSPREDR